MTNTRPWAPVAAAIVALVGVDLAIKRSAVMFLAEAPVDLPGALDLELSYNSGTAFGLFSNVPSIVLSIVVFAFVIAVLNLWLAHRAPTGAVVLVVAGGLANAIDRLEGGSVVDMVHTGWWPNFNVADIFINTGIAYWIISTLPRHATDAGDDASEP